MFAQCSLSMPSPTAELDWSEWLSRYLETFASPSQKDLIFGKTVLRENPNFASAWLSFVATETGFFDSFQAFEQRFKKTISIPRKPLIDPPSRKNVLKSELPRFIEKEVEYRQTQNAYREKRERYESEQEALDHFKSTYAKTPESYLQFVQDTAEGDLADCLSRSHEIPVPYQDRWMHTYITGGTGSGKTESLKTLIHHQITRDPDSAVVIIDPHGELCFQVAQFQEFRDSDRLVYIDPKIFPDHHPVFNPFEIDPEMVQDEDALDRLEQEISKQLSMALGEESETTPIMKAVLTPCITTLLMMPDGHFGHLLDFMSKKGKRDLLQFAEANLPNEYSLQMMREHFANLRNDTRQGIVYRLAKLVGKSNFVKATCGPSTFDLEKLIDERKIIVFNLSSKSLGEEGSMAFGRLLMAKLFSIAKMRDIQKDPNGRYAPIHLFVDECQKYCTETVEEVLIEARKFGLHATLANQSSENIRDSKVRDAILTNTNVKMVGREGVATYRKKSAENIEASPDQIADLAVGKFIVRSGRMPSFTAQNGSSLIKQSNSMTPEQWNRVLEKQKQLYYRQKDTSPPPPPKNPEREPEPPSIFDTTPPPEKPAPLIKPPKKRGFNLPEEK